MPDIVRSARAMWSKKAREHALKLRNRGLSDMEIGAMMGRSAKSVEHALAGATKPGFQFKTLTPPSRRAAFYNRVEIASMLALTVDELIRHQVELEEDHGLPKSTRARYSVPRRAFNRWLKKREYPDLTPLEFAEQARAAFLKACFSNQPSKEINRAARVLRVAEATLALLDG